MKKHELNAMNESVIDVVKELPNGTIILSSKNKLVFANNQYYRLMNIVKTDDETLI